MSWLDDINNSRVYIYRNDAGDKISGTPKQLEELFETTLKLSQGEAVNHDGDYYVYAGFEPVKLGGETRVEFEKNGRKGVHIRKPDGDHQYISKTKLHYIKTGRIENQYTNSFKEYVAKKEQEQLRETEKNVKRAKVVASSLQMLAAKKQVPHDYIPTEKGWHSPDGKKFIPLEDK
jgi:hypothetical protein